MEQFIDFLPAWMATQAVIDTAEAIVKIIFGFILARLAGKGTVRLFVDQADVHTAMLLRRIVFYLVFGLFLVSALHGLGIDLTVLLGAAGILTVAIGFASQTSASNLISGLFLLGEKPFAVGEVVKVGDTIGEVLSIDLLSVKLRTFDNLFVRIPNETMIKSEITNMRRFPIRRVDVTVGVAYKEDMRKVRTTLMEVADKNPLSLEEPRPVVIFQGFKDSALEFMLGIWTTVDNFREMRTRIPTEIKEAFDEKGIEIPFPHRSLYTGSITDPFPIRLISDGADGLDVEQVEMDEGPESAD